MEISWTTWLKLNKEPRGMKIPSKKENQYPNKDNRGKRKRNCPKNKEPDGPSV